MREAEEVEGIRVEGKGGGDIREGYWRASEHVGKE